MRTLSKALCLCLCAALCICFACAERPAALRVCLVIDIPGGIGDPGGISDSIWDAFKLVADEYPAFLYDYSYAVEDSERARMQASEEAIAGGSNLIISPGWLFENTAYKLQIAYPEVDLLLMDAEPFDGESYVSPASKHVACIRFHVEEAGFLAGYAVVREGYTNLGIIAGFAVPEVQRYCYGFLQGADAAAAELGISAELSIRHWNADTFGPGEHVQEKASQWYADGVELIFGCGGALYISCELAVQEPEQKVIVAGVFNMEYLGYGDPEDSAILFSPTLNIREATVIALRAYLENGNAWPAHMAGKTLRLGVREGCVQLAMLRDEWNLTRFTRDDYEALLARMRDGYYAISDNTDAPPLLSIFVDWEDAG